MFDSVNALPKRTTGWYVKVAVAILVAFFIMIALLGSWYTVDEKERAVVLRNKAVIATAAPGLHFKAPIMDSVEMISVQSYSTTYDKLDAYSFDQQNAVIKASVNWHVDPARVTEVYSCCGTVENLAARTIQRYMPQALENTFGQYNAVNAVQKRGQLVVDVTKMLREMAVAGGPIVIDSVQLENIDFSDDYEKSIAARMKAEVAVGTRKQDLDRERVDADITVTKAKAAADSSLAQATADAQSTRLRGEAEAYAIKVKSDALAANPALVELTKAERWDGKLPTTMLPNSAIPFIDAKK